MFLYSRFKTLFLTFLSLFIIILLTLNPRLMASQMTAERSLFPNHHGFIAPQLKFEQNESGDLYLATIVDDQILFIDSQGNVSPEAAPYLSEQIYSGTIALPQFDTALLPSGHYPLYQIVVHPGSNVFNFENWIGGLGALNVMNFSVGIPNSISQDNNNDGWSDDDENHDGFYDDDHNKDGYHDDDHNKDGYHDDSHSNEGSYENETENEEESENENESEHEDEEENEIESNESKHEDEND